MGLGMKQEKVWFHGILVVEVSTPLKSIPKWMESHKIHVPNHQLGISWDLTRINGNAIGFGLGIECRALGFIATEDIIGDLMELIGILWYLVRYSEINEIQ